MKLLFDQNLSRRLVKKLAMEFPGSEHSSDFGLDQADDRVVWDRARADGFLITSKDADFLHLAMVRGIHRRWCIWRSGIVIPRRSASF